MLKDLLLLTMVGLASSRVCAGQESSPGAEVLASPEIQILVKAAIEDRLKAGDLPDGGMLRNTTRIAVREEMPSARLRLGPESLPQFEGREFYFVSQPSAQAEA